MLTVSKVPVSSSVARVVFCVDACSDSDISGRLVSRYLPEPVPIKSAGEFMLGTSRLLDSFSFPQRAFAPRNFRDDGIPNTGEKTVKEVECYMTEEQFREQRGEKSTFVVQIQFRQNATWQGNVQWVEQKKSKKFRSALELLRLIGEAVDEAPDDPEQVEKW